MSLPYSLLSGPSGIGDTKLHDERIGDRDDFTHDYAACQDELCILCSAYLDGYNQGEEKAYFKVRNWHPQQHAPSCGCNPCMAARSVLSKVTR